MERVLPINAYRDGDKIDFKIGGKINEVVNIKCVRVLDIELKYNKYNISNIIYDQLIQDQKEK